MILDGGVCVCACLFAAPCVRAHNYCDADRASACTHIAHMERVARVVGSMPGWRSRTQIVCYYISLVCDYFVGWSESALHIHTQTRVHILIWDCAHTGVFELGAADNASSVDLCAPVRVTLSFILMTVCVCVCM